MKASKILLTLACAVATLPACLAQDTGVEALDVATNAEGPIAYIVNTDHTVSLYGSAYRFASWIMRVALDSLKTLWDTSGNISVYSPSGSCLFSPIAAAPAFPGEHK